MLKKILLFASLSTMVFGEYKPWNYNFVEGSLIKGKNNPDGYGDSKKDFIFEIQGSTRYNLLDLYWFVDRSNIFKDSSLSDKNGVDNNYTYGEFNPRISLDGLLNKDLSVGPISEWFISTQVDFDNVRGSNSWESGLKKYYVGIGNYISIPEMEYLKFNYFKTNLYARYSDRNYGRSENEWDGYLFNISYGGTIYKFENGMRIGFSGWLDYDFGADKSRSFDTDDSLQWQNQLRLYFNDNISVSYTYQINNHFSQVNQNSSNSDSRSIGLHYGITF